MPTLTTMDELEALAPGQTIAVGDRTSRRTTWTRNERGFVWENVELGPEHFVGYLNGRINVGVVYEQGQMYHGGRYYYLILQQTASPEETSGWWVARFEASGNYSQLTIHDELEGVTPVSDGNLPAWYRAALSLGLALVTQVRRSSERMRQSEQLQGELTEAQRDARRSASQIDERVNTFRSQFGEALNQLLVGQPDEFISRLAPVMMQHGLPAPQGITTVTMRVIGVSRLQLRPHQVAPFIPEGTTPADTTLTIRPGWHIEVPVEVQVPHGSCGCRSVGRGEVSRALSAKGIDPYDFSHEARFCTSEQCLNAGNKPRSTPEGEVF